MISLCEEDIIFKISESLCIYHYRDVKKYKNISKSFNKYISNMLKKFNDCDDEYIYMASQVKHWRPELDQIDYLYNNFMIFDDYDSYLYWRKNSKTFQTELNGLDNEVLMCNLYQFSTFNKNIFSEESKKVELTFVEHEFIDKNYDTMPKLFFDTYFIYYFIEDYRCCYGISFIILPYFDKSLLDLKMFHSYNIVKKNKLMNHNIKKIHNIDF